ncbi:prophage tail fiber N-terminal domain-containing protein [Vibrio casei]|uniref:Lambda-like tail fibre protein N-terminal domain-containing protein n=1 Tax=Vibrio casei TaxID=673372 RepID=A0A368LHT2_9VIBR|nr:prophage tail fiber N-terminal domain-containing protein [Vibrio casei]RCS70186.1 hypothetical protein CIK83_12030 [Vibrio casei]
MAVTVSGILRDSGGNPSPNDVIKFYTVQGFNGALPSATLEVVTSETGSYDFELSVGIHILSVQYDRILTRVGKVTVTSETPSPQTLDTLLALGEPLLPDEIIAVKQLVAEANAAAQSVSEDANKVAQDKDEVAQNTQTVSEKTQIVVDAQSNVIEKAQQVATNTETVNEKTQTVLDAQADVTAKANQVASDAQQVSSDKQTVLDAKSDVTAKANQVASDAQQVSENASQVALDKGSVDEAAEEIATAQAVIGTSIDGVYANAAAIVSLNDTILRLHPIYEAEE